MKPFIIDHWGTGSNQLLSALYEFVVKIVHDPTADIDSPEVFEDRITEWLGEHGRSYRRCRWESVVMMIRPYRTHYYPYIGYKGPLDCPCLRIFYEGQDSLSMFLVIAIGFLTDDLSGSESEMR